MNQLFGFGAWKDLILFQLIFIDLTPDHMSFSLDMSLETHTAYLGAIHITTILPCLTQHST